MGTPLVKKSHFEQNERAHRCQWFWFAVKFEVIGLHIVISLHAAPGAITPTLVFCAIRKKTNGFKSLPPNISVTGGPWQMRTVPEYLAESRRCQIEFCVDTLHKRALIFAALRYDKKTKGRALRCDLPDLLLRKGDRLEPGGALGNASEFETKSLPFTIVFWRAGKDDHLLHASPLWTLRGLSMAHFTVDLLHSWHLGGCLMFTAAVFWHVLDCGIWSPDASGFSKPEKDKMALMVVRQKMWAYYKTREKTDLAFKSKGSRAPSQKIIQ